MSAPLRDPYAEPSSSSSSSTRPGTSLSLGLPRSRGGRPMLLAKPSPTSNSNSGRGREGEGGGDQPVLSGAELRKKYEDDSIRGTDGDALGSRLSALQAGYFAGAPTQGHSGRTKGSSLDGRREGPEREPDVWSALFSGGGGIVPMHPPSHPNGHASANGGTPSHLASRGNHTTSLPRQLGPPPVTRRPPIINIGTYLRCEMIDRLVEDFLLADAGTVGSGDATRKGKGRQIISVGAGSDARYWRIMSNSRLAPRLSHYLELDFPQVVTKKLASIQRFPRLQEHLYPPSQEDPQAESPSGSSEGPALHTRKYTLRSCDLRALSGSFPETQAQAGLLLASLDPDTPTLILAECVLAYMPPEASVQLLKRIASRIEPGSEVRGICYEMCIAGDEGGEGGHALGEGSVRVQNWQQHQPEATGDVSKFGRAMLANLETRGLSLQGARAFPTPFSHANRFQAAFMPAGPESTCNTVKAGASSLRQIWRSLPPQERERLSRVEGLDEVEELELLLSCYCLSWATRRRDDVPHVQ